MKTNKLLIYIFLFLISTALSELTEAKDIYNKKWNLNYFLPGGWHKAPSKKWNEITYINNDKLATINIYIYKFSEPVTVNAFQQKIMTGKYDGWINLFQRDASELEIKKANVYESAIAVYSHNELQPDLSVKKKLVGEYYYIKDLNGYIISAQTNHELWHSIQNSVKTIVESFWIGNGQRPNIKISSSDMNNWLMFGRDATNRQYINSEIKLAENISTNWEKVFTKNRNNSIVNPTPIIANENIYFSINRHIYSLSIKSGNINWDYEIGTIEKSMAFNEDILFFIKEGSTPFLYALMSQNGSILYKKALKNTNHSHPIVFEGDLFLIEDRSILAFNAETGEQKWQRDYDLDPDKYPVVSGNYLVLVDNKNNLLVCNRSSGNLIWSKNQSKKISFTPSIYNNNVLICIETETLGEEISLLKAYDLTAGKESWQFSSSIFRKVKLMPAIGKDLLVALFDQENGLWHNAPNIFIAFDIKTGEIAWQQQVPILPGTSLIAPIVTNQLALLKAGVEDRKTIFGFDIATGETFTTIGLSNKNNKLDSSELLSIRLYKGNIVLTALNKDKITLLCKNANVN